MKKMRIPFKVFVIFLAGTAFAQSVDEFDAWMRTIDEKNQSVQRNIAAKDASAAAADAKVLQETFKLVEGFWKQRGSAPDAVALSQKAQQLAGEVVKLIAAKDFDSASAQSIKVAETCTACHRLYRPL
jgi:glutamyl-tRNA reductase